MFYTHFYFIGLKRAAKLARWGAIYVTIVLPFGLIHLCLVQDKALFLKGFNLGGYSVYDALLRSYISVMAINSLKNIYWCWLAGIYQLGLFVLIVPLNVCLFVSNIPVVSLLSSLGLISRYLFSLVSCSHWMIVISVPIFSFFSLLLRSGLLLHIIKYRCVTF